MRLPFAFSITQVASLTRRYVFRRLTLLVVLVLSGCTAVGLHFATREFASEKTGLASLAAAKKVTVRASDRGQKYFRFRDGRAAEVAYRGEAATIGALQSGQGQPRAMASGVLAGNAIPDLVAGYSWNGAGIVTVQHGNADAYAPSDESVYRRMQEGYNPESLLPNADTYNVPESVDFLQVGDFNHDGFKDVLTAARGGSAVFLLAGDGRGGLSVAERIAMSGVVRAMTAGEFRGLDGFADFAVALDGAAGSVLQIFDGAPDAADGPMSVPLSMPATSLEFEGMDHDGFQDVVALSGSEVVIVHGWGRKVSANIAAQVERIEMGVNGRELAAGFFIWNRQFYKQIAVLSNDGTLTVWDRANSDTRPYTEADEAKRNRTLLQKTSDSVDPETLVGWTQADAAQWVRARTINASADIAADAALRNVLVSGRLSPFATEDLMVLDRGSNRVSVVRQDDAARQSGASQSSGGGENTALNLGAGSDAAAGDLTATNLASTAQPGAVLELPKKRNGEQSFVILQPGAAQIVPITPAATITVDRTDDPDLLVETTANDCTAAANDCSLRGAVAFSNIPANSGTVISIPAGTYTLTRNGTSTLGCDSGGLGDLNINQTTTIVGAGSGGTVLDTTIVQQGTGVTNQGDRVMCLDTLLAGNLTHDFSAVAIVGGRDSGINTAGGIIAGMLNNTLTLTNVRMANNQSSASAGAGSGGGAIQIVGGNLNITNSIIGGSAVPLTFDPSIVANRSNVNAANSCGTSGGAINWDPSNGSVPGGTGTLTITTTTFQNNKSTSVGGGGAVDINNIGYGSGGGATGSATFNNCAFTSNVANNGAGSGNGGAILIESLSATVNSVAGATTFTSNDAGNGGGAIYASGSLNLTGNATFAITFSSNTAAVNKGSSIGVNGGTTTVSGTNITVGGDIFVATNGTWVNATGSSISPNNFLLFGGSLTCNNSTMNITNDFTLSKETTHGFTFNGNTATINIAGDLSVDLNNGGSGATGVFNANSSTFNFNGTGTQSVSNTGTGSPVTFFNLTDSNTTQPLTISNSLNVSNTLNVNGANAIFDPVAAAVIGGAGTLTGSGTARVRRTGASGFLNQYTITNKTLTNLTVEYIGAAAQDLSGTTYGPLKINNANGVTLSSGAAVVNGLLTLTTGALTINNGTTLSIFAGHSIGTGTIAGQNTSTVNYAQTSDGQAAIAGNYGNLTFSNFNKTLPSTGTVGVSNVFTPGTATGHTITGSTFDFNGTGAQTVPAFNFNNLTFSGAHTVNNITLANGGTIGVAGAFTHTATFTSGTYIVTNNTFDFNGAGAQTVTAFQFYNNLTISGNKNNNVITLGSGTVRIVGSFTIPATNINSFTVTGNTIDYSGSAAQTMPTQLTTYNNLTLNNPSGVTPFSGLTVNNLLRVQAGTFTSNAATYKDVQIDNSTTLAGTSATTINVSGNWTNNGSYTANSNLVNFNGSAPQALNGANATTFNDLTINNPTTVTVNNIVAAAVDATVGGALTLTTDLTVASSAILQQSGTSAGAGDVTGTVRRADLGGTTRAFGNPFNTIAITAGTAPTQMDFNLVKGVPGFAGAVNRSYTLTPTGGAGISATLGLHYLDTELNGNTEANLGLWRGPTFASLGRSSPVDTGNNQVVLSNVDAFSPWALAAMPEVSVSVSAAVKEDGATNLTYTFTRTGSTAGALTANFLVSGDATLTTDYAASGADTFTAINGTVTFTAGNANALVTVNPVVDTDAENNETVILTVDTGTSYLVGSPSAATGTINNDETLTTITSDNPDPSAPGQAITVTYTVVGNLAGSPAGNVQVTDGVDSNTCTVAAGSCSLTLNTVGARTIVANYLGDANFNASSSAGENHDVCSSPVVTNTNDNGAGSLRQVIIEACEGSTITFQAGVIGTIALTTGELAINKNLTIDAPAGNVINVTGSLTSRVFNINSGKTLTIRNLTVSNATTAGDGGAILNDGTLTLLYSVVSQGTALNGGGIRNNGTLTVVNSLISGNTANSDGGGISQGSSAISMTLINTTISGNNAAGFGAGVDVLGGTATIINNTIVKNNGDSDNNDAGGAGGIRKQGGTGVTIHNTIVAGNVRKPAAPTADDIGGTVEAASSFNLVSDSTTAGGLTHGGGNSNIVGNAGAGTLDVLTVIVPTLGVNGGPTPTHALVRTGPAVEAGGNANLPADTFDLDGDANIAEPLSADQRGGATFPRVADSADANTTQTVDIGAFELHPSIEDIPNQVTNEDTPLAVNFNIGDGTGTLIASVTAGSNNAAIVTNANLVITGSGATRTLTITPELDANFDGSGLATISVAVTATNGTLMQDSFDLTVTAVNDAPTFQIPTNPPPAVNEDAALQTISNFATTFVPGPPTASDEGLQTLVGYTLTQTGTTGGLTFSTAPSISNTGTLTYQPAADKNGTATYNVVATDSGSGIAPNVNQSAPIAFTITVNAQNDDPTLTTNAGLSVTIGGSGTIDNTKLKVDDIDNSAAQLIFTIGTAPTEGNLKKGAVVLSAGNTFTQDDINNNQITYDHVNVGSLADSFTFTVSDGAGGSIGLTTFNITAGGCANSSTVTSTADGGAGSLRQAISSLCDGGTINFNIPGGGPDTITLTTGVLAIDKSMTINGPTAKSLTISGNNASRIFNVDPGKTLTFSSLTISSGSAAFGGGIYNQGTLTIIASTIRNNAAANGANNGGASNGGNGGDGGGLYNAGTLNVINSTISLNQAGHGGNATGSGLGGNGGNGGGIYNGGTLLLINNSISENRAGNNGLNVNGDETNVDLGTPGQGGGVFTATTTSILRNTIVAGNLNAFFSHNNNVGGTSVQDNNNDVGGTFDGTSAFNLIGAIDGSSGIVAGSDGNQAGSADAPLNPLFSALTNNGGPTSTYMPQQFSPAIDLGSNALATDQNSVALTTDQRGTGFGRILNGTVDIGAVETTPPPPPPPSADLGVTKLASADESLADRDLVYTITVINGGPDASVNAKLDDVLPGDLTFVSLPPVAGWSCVTPAVGANGTVTCTNANFAAGGSAVFTLTAHIPSGSPGGTFYFNTATVSSNTTNDPNSVNNDYPVGTTVVSCVTGPVVTSNADNGSGSLRQAIIDACDGSTIGFDMNQVVSPITLTSTELAINKNLTIQGPGANLLTVMRSAAGGTPQFRIFNIGSGVAVNISGLTINNGDAGAFLGGGVLNSGTLTLTASAVTGNTALAGGGVLNTNGTMTITESTISGNTSGQGAGITNSNNGTLTLYNSTISGNTGDGLANVSGGDANITNATFSDNSTRGITSQGAGTTTNIRNTIVANTPGANADVSGDFVSQGNNLIGKNDGSTGFTNLVNNDKVGTIASPLNALLAVLGNYGGPTQTQALLPGSPAINAANNCVFDNTCVPALAAAITTDQRGFGRQVNTTVDIGAYESRGFTVTATSGTPQTTIVGTAFGAPLLATVSSAFGEPVAGGQLTFTAPGAGASATFTGGVTTINMTLNASGEASASATANTTVGGPYNVTATGDGVTGTANFSLTNIKASQTISFAGITDKTFGDADFVVSPTATSGLPVSLGATGNCTVTSPSPGTVHITGAGACTITASQAGDATFDPAPNVQQGFTINKANQTISFAGITDRTFGDADFVVSPTAASGLPVSLGATGNCTVTSPSPGTVHITGAGSCTITASQAGNSNFNAAPNVPQSFPINKANQTITFGALANKTFGDADFAVTATTSSGLAVSLAASGNCTVTSPSPGTVHITGAGSCTITASQAGDANYNAAPNVPQNFTINKANQTITFGALANKTFGDADFAVTATASSGLAVSLAASGNCTVTSPSPGTVHITGAGSCTITASQAGDANYNAAGDVPQTFTISKANQTITFGALPNKTFGDPDFTVSPTASSGLAVALSSTGQCTVTTPSPGTVHLTGAGGCTITASQAGNANFNAAPDEARSFTTLRATTNTVVTSSANPSDVGQSVTFTATVSSGAGTPTGTVQFKDGGANLGSPVALNGSGVAQFTTSTLTAGTHTITAEYGITANFEASTGTLAGGQLVSPSLSINDVSVIEGNAGTQTLTFTVTLSAASNVAVTTNYTTANGTASAPSDYAAIASTLLTFNPGDTSKTVSVTINGDVDFESDETFTVNLSSPVNATISDNQGTGTIQNDDAQGGVISFSNVSYSVNEIAGVVTLTVVRTNDISQAVNVDYATEDTGSPMSCAALDTGLASQRCDFTSFFGTLKFAANESQKTIDVPIHLDAYQEGPETFTLKLSNPTGGAVLAVPSTAVVTINDSVSPTPNPLDDTTSFVRQQYRDFLNREPDPAGLAFWVNNIDKCNDPAQRPAGQTLAQCIEVQRITTSAAFFLSIEFKQTGGLVRDFYVAALDRPATNNMPNYVEFMRDSQGIQRGVVVGQGNWQQLLNANRIAFMNEFVTRAEFVGLYPATDTPTQYVDKLYLHANVAPGSPQERLDAIGEFGGAGTAADAGARGRALLLITQNAGFQARELNRGFVQMQYFGYLRRNPNDLPDGNFNGYNFWVNKLNQFNGNFLDAEMVKAFLNSLEYRSRFGP